ncbi:MAG: 2-succinyl-6-hydroxy-2,4-cyclohexadiene-1-carboxy late synthase [Simkaniaceae bacterium]
MLFSTSQGNISQFPICFLHGLLGSHEDFQEIIKEFRNRHHCIAIDLPGHGNSDFNSNYFREDPFKATIEAIYRTLLQRQIRRCHIIGYSMGGRLAMLLGKKYPGLIGKMIILSSHPGLKKEARKKRKNKDNAWADLIEEYGLDTFLTRWYDQALFKNLRSKDKFACMLKQRKRNHPHAIAWALRNLSLAKQPSLNSFLQSPPFPLLWICGGRDEKYQNLYAAMKKTYPKLRLQQIAECSHALHIENPKECFRVIEPFLED